MALNLLEPALVRVAEKKKAQKQMLIKSVFGFLSFALVLSLSLSPQISLGFFSLAKVFNTIDNIVTKATDSLVTGLTYVLDKDSVILSTLPIQTPVHKPYIENSAQVLGENTKPQAQVKAVKTNSFTKEDAQLLIDHSISKYLTTQGQNNIQNQNSIQQQTTVINNAPVVSYISQLSNQSGFNGSIAGFSQLSSHAFQTDTATVKDSLNLQGGLTVSGQSTLASTTISGLTVSGTSTLGAVNLNSIVLSKNMSTIGPELVTNGMFDSGSDGWTLDSNVIWQSGKIVFTGTNRTIETPVNLVAGKYYILSYDITDATGGVSFWFYNNNWWVEGDYRFNGSHKIVFYSDFTGQDTIGITLDAGDYLESTASLDNVSIKEIGEIPFDLLQYKDINGSNLVSIGGIRNNIAFGYDALKANTSGSGNIALGNSSLMSNTTGQVNIAIGPQALAWNTTGILNIAIGQNALFNNNVGRYNLALGFYALFNNTFGEQNIALGLYALQDNATGSANSALGSYAMRNNVSGSGNVAFGSNALESNTAGSYNSAFGVGTLNFTQGSRNTAVGAGALTQVRYGDYNAVLGSDAGKGDWSLASSTGSVYVGYQSGYSLTGNANYNIFVGYKTGYSNTSGAYNIAIGQNVNLPSNTGSQQLNIGNVLYGTGMYNGATVSSNPSSTGRIGIGTTTPTATLAVKGIAGNIDAFTIASSSNAVFLTVRPTGYVGIGTTTPTLGPLVMGSGAYVTTGGTWTNASDVNLKENFASVTPASILEKIVSLPIRQWNYKLENASTTHIGPTAQDFYSAFGLGGSDTSISTIDPAGVALLGIQALNQKIQDLQGSLTGNATVTNLTVYSPSNFSGDSVGEAKILAGATSVRITFSTPYEYQPVVVATSKEFINGQYRVTDENSTGFTLEINQVQDKDITFAWHSFASKEAKLFISDGTSSNIELVVVPSVSLPEVNLIVVDNLPETSDAIETKLEPLPQPEAVPDSSENNIVDDSGKTEEQNNLSEITDLINVVEDTPPPSTLDPVLSE